MFTYGRFIMMYDKTIKILLSNYSPVKINFKKENMLLVPIKYILWPRTLENKVFQVQLRGSTRMLI